MSTIFLPKKIKVGYRTREDTYTGRLAYVIYYDAKGKLRKETSWQTWRSSTGYGYEGKPVKESHEFENVPTEGFVLNKKAGGISYNFVCQNLIQDEWHDQKHGEDIECTMRHAFDRVVSELAKVTNKSDWANPYHLKEKLIAEDVLL